MACQGRSGTDFHSVIVARMKSQTEVCATLLPYGCGIGVASTPTMKALRPASEFSCRNL